MTNRIVLLFAAGAALALSGCGSDAESDANQVTANLPEAPADGAQTPAGTEAAGAVRLAVGTKEPFGQFLVDGEGRSLYVLEGSRMQSDSGTASKECTGACLGEWPALTASGSPEAAQGLDAAKLGTMQRDGAMQVTYAGWPLFYYVGDQQPGSTSGQDLHDQFGEWYLLSPAGDIVETEE